MLKKHFARVIYHLKKECLSDAHKTHFAFKAPKDGGSEKVNNKIQSSDDAL